MSDESPQRPASNDDCEGWKAYWKVQGMPWRTEPEIDEERQAYLAERRAVKPDIEKGIYPFRNESGSIKLTRADVEWLITTHKSSGYIGPVDWNDEKQRARDGLDLRGADLRDSNLNNLLLTRMLGGLPLRDLGNEPETIVSTWAEAAAVHFERANLSYAHLEGAQLFRAHFEDCVMSVAHLEQSTLVQARLERATLIHAWLSSTTLADAHLENANLGNAHLEGAVLAWLVTRNGRVFRPGAHLAGADLRDATCDARTYLHEVSLYSAEHGSARLVDIGWGGANLAVVSWPSNMVVRDEQIARRWHSDAHNDANSQKLKQSEAYEPETKLEAYRDAVRANRQLAVALRERGLREQSDYFDYRALKLHMQELFLQGALLHSFSSLLLYLIAGYGYRPLRSLGTYVLVVLGFAFAYFTLGQSVGPQLSPLAALITSIVSFHGRGFFPQSISLDDPVMWLVASEAIIGLLIEITFIATFTQRFFAR